MFLQCLLGRRSLTLSPVCQCALNTVGNLTIQALVVKAASDVPTLLWGSLPPLLCQNWERLSHLAQDITLQKGGTGRPMSPGEDSTKWAQGAEDGGWQLWSHSRCSSQPGSAGVSVTSLKTVEEL